MRLIAHRGNLYGPNPARENSPDYVDEASAAGCDVEVDVWYECRGWSLGHDAPQYPITFEWLWRRRDSLWLHCKNLEALSGLINTAGTGLFNAFWHESDAYTLTTKGYIWTSPTSSLGPRCVLVGLDVRGASTQISIHGLCTDYPLA